MTNKQKILRLCFKSSLVEYLLNIPILSVALHLFTGTSWTESIRTSVLIMVLIYLMINIHEYSMISSAIKHVTDQQLFYCVYRKNLLLKQVLVFSELETGEFKPVYGSVKDEVLLDVTEYLEENDMGDFVLVSPKVKLYRL